jgi:hypothetical protein
MKIRKTATEKVIAANRANGRKTTGLGTRMHGSSVPTSGPYISASAKTRDPAGIPLCHVAICAGGDATNPRSYHLRA